MQEAFISDRVPLNFTTVDLDEDERDHEMSEPPQAKTKESEKEFQTDETISERVAGIVAHIWYAARELIETLR